MPFHENGFLGEDADRFVKEHRAQFKTVFELARKINRLAHSLMNDLKVQRVGACENAGVALYLRVLNSYASTFRLMEFGLGIDAGTVLRSCVESTVFLKKISKEPQWATEYIRASEEKRLRFIKQIQADKTGKLNFMKSDPKKVQSERERLEAAGFGDGPHEFKVAQIASTVGLEDIYNTAYRYLSENSTHSSARSLESHLDQNAQGKVVGLKHLPIVDDNRLMFTIASTSLIVAMSALLELFEPDPAKPHVQAKLQLIYDLKGECEIEAQKQLDPIEAERL